MNKKVVEKLLNDLKFKLHKEAYKIKRKSLILEQSNATDEEDSNRVLKEISKLDEEFIKFRTSRDKKLAAPTLLLPSIQVNIDAGKLPQSESNGKKYLKIPLTIES